jgi:hypothetical protein
MATTSSGFSLGPASCGRRPHQLFHHGYLVDPPTRTTWSVLMVKPASSTALAQSPGFSLSGRPPGLKELFLVMCSPCARSGVYRGDEGQVVAGLQGHGELALRPLWRLTHPLGGRSGLGSDLWPFSVLNCSMIHPPAAVQCRPRPGWCRRRWTSPRRPLSPPGGRDGKGAARSRRPHLLALHGFLERRAAAVGSL